MNNMRTIAEIKKEIKAEFIEKTKSTISVLEEILADKDWCNSNSDYDKESRMKIKLEKSFCNSLLKKIK